MQRDGHLHRPDGLTRSSTTPSQGQHLSRRQSAGTVTSKTFDGANRSRSVVQRAHLPPLASAVSLESPGSHASSGNDPVSPGAHPPGSAQTTTSPVAGSIKPELSPEASPHESHQRPANNTALGRAESEVSLYAPSRRRSAILTPGVATRSEHSDVSVSTKSSFRKSAPPPLGEFGWELDESRVHQHLSTPPRSSEISDAPERVATPSEAEYQQIGGIKFGSLRITNATPAPSPGPERAPKMTSPMSSLGVAKNQVSSRPEEAIIHHLASSAAEVKQPKPLSGALSPVVASFSDASTNAVEPSDGVSPLPPAMQPSAQNTPDLLSVHQKPDVRLSESATISNDKRKSTIGVGRSDSGFGSSSSSSSSSEGPRMDSASKADSGYGSSLSLKSLLGSKRGAKQTKNGAVGQLPPASVESREKRLDLRDQAPYQPSAKDTSEDSGEVAESQGQPRIKENTHASTRDENNSALRRRSFLGSFKSRKSRESQTQQSGHSRGLSAPDVPPRDVQNETPSPSSGARNDTHKPKKLQKLIATARRRSLPSMVPSQPQQHDVPSMPSDAAEKLEQHNRIFDEGSKQPSFQVNVAAREVPKTFVTVESQEVVDKPSVRHTMAAIDRPRPKSTGPIPQQLSRSISVLTANPPAPRKSILRRSRTAADLLDNSDDEEGVPDYILGYEVQVASIDSIRRSAGNSAFDAAFVPMAEDNEMEAAMRRMGPPGPIPKTPDGPRPYPRLRTRSSAPDFLETVSEPASPGSVDCYSQKKPKTPPPISIRTRGSKKKKRRRAPHSTSHGARYIEQHHPPMPDPRVYDGRLGFNSTNEQDLRQSLRSFPVPRPPGDVSPKRLGNRPEHSVGYNRRPPTRPVYQLPVSRSESDMGIRRYPPPAPPNGSYPSQVHGPHHGPGEYDPQGPSYRVLHSYNPSAYKGVPIRN